MPRVVVIEDHANLRKSISLMLSEADHEVTPTATLAEATAACRLPTDLVILDVMLPDGSGIDWLREFRSGGQHSYVLILTARDALRDRISGLDAGADDYLVKPFAMAELLARVRAMLRREERAPKPVLSVAGLELSLLSREVRRGTDLLCLTARQFDLLACLMRHANQIVTREMIARDVWKDASATWTNVIEVHINQLRKKLDLPGRPSMLQTIRGKGYVFGDPV